MSTDAILDALTGVVTAPGGTWKALCPIHGDENQSLSIKQCDDGATLMNCFGCDNKGPDFVEAVGLDPSELYAPDSATSDYRQRIAKPRPVAKKARPKVKRAPLGPVVATYDYVDEGGEFLYQATRHDPKDFRQRRNPRPEDDPKTIMGGWVWSVAGCRMVPYHLPWLIDAVGRGETIYVVEGEKDVATAEALGLTATCNAAGSKKGVWRPEYSEFMRGADVVVIPDMDPKTKWNENLERHEPHMAGQKHGGRVAGSLCGVARTVKVFELPCKDLSDWVADTNGGKEDLEHMIEADAVDGAKYSADMAGIDAPVETKQPEIKLAKPMEIAPSVKVPTFANNDQTDIGASDRLIERYGHELRYCQELKRWFVWSGAVWKEDKVGSATARAKAVARENTMAQFARGDKEWKKGLLLENASKIRGCLELAAVDDKIAVTAEVFDQYPDVLACPNGTIDLRTGALMDPDPTMLLTQMAPTVYDGSAGCGDFDAFMDSIMMGSDEMVEFMRLWLGYCITGQSREQALVVAHGSGANGKGTLFDTVSDVIGPLAAEAPQGLLTAKRNDAHPAELMTVRGRRLVTASEVPKGATWDEARLKWLTGEDTITARGMRQDFVSWKPTHKLTVYLNNKPRVTDSSPAFWRRMLLVPFDGSFGPDTSEHDPLLRDKLRAEHQGILAWLVRGAVQWYDGGLTRPGVVSAATEAYREDEDTIGLWMAYYRIGNSAPHDEKANDLYDNYKGWSEQNNERACTKRDFSQSMGELGVDKTRKKDGIYYLFEGVDEVTGCSVVQSDKYNTLCTRTSARNPRKGTPGYTTTPAQETAPKDAPKRGRFDDTDLEPF